MNFMTNLFNKTKPLKKRKARVFKREVILNIPDLHIPYEHRDVIPFLTAVKEKYKPTRVISLGDELDYHAASFHRSDADLPSAGDELKLSIKKLRPFVKLFPKLEIIDSNHGSMMFRKFKHHGLPLKALTDNNRLLEVPKGWTWHNELLFRMNNGRYVMYRHNVRKNALEVAKSYGVNFVEGHYHTEFRIDYFSQPLQLIWSINGGCLICRKSMAFAYNKTDMPRPVLGVSVIINGIPRLIPMVLKTNGRWDGVVH